MTGGPHDVISGDIGRLEAYGEDVGASVWHAEEARTRYSQAVARFNDAQPNDLGSAITDRTATIGNHLRELRTVNRIPPAFATALRIVDERGLDLDTFGANPLFDNLVEAATAMPLAASDQIVRAALRADEARRAQSEAEGRALAELYVTAWSDPHTNAHIDAHLAMNSDDAAFILGFVLQMDSYDPQALVQAEIDRLNGSGWERLLFGGNYMAQGDEIVEIQMMGVGGLMRAIRLGRPHGPPISRPTVVSGGKLQNIINNLYKHVERPGRVGTGTTADAVRHELLTGRLTGGLGHITKARGEIRGLRNWLRRNPDAPYRDRLIAQSLLDDLLDALATVSRRGGP